MMPGNVFVYTNAYSGPERRCRLRRNEDERRGMIRWEPDKDDRRIAYGRRAADCLVSALR
jgi:hypothetical protein